MASHLYYNGVVLELTRTNAYTQEPVYAEGAPDLLGVKVTLDVDAVYSPQRTSYLRTLVGSSIQALAAKGYAPAVTDGALRAMLNQPRGLLLYVIGGTEVVRSPLAGAALDPMGGPTPRMVAVKQLTEHTWRVGFRIETFLCDCPLAASSTGILSNRWTQTHQVGPDHLTTVVTRGASVFRLDALYDLGVSADYFRSLCLPPHYAGMQRQSQIVRLNEMGNALVWEVVDRERFVSLGETGKQHGVIDFEAKYSQETKPVGESGAASEYQVATIEVVARGDRESNRASMLAWCAKLAYQRLPLYVLQDPKQVIIPLRVYGGEQMDAPVVTLAMSFMFTPPPRDNAVAPGLDLSTLGVDLVPLLQEGFASGVNPQLPGGARGHYRGEAFAASLRSALLTCTPPPMQVGVTQVPDPISDPDAGRVGITEDTYLANSMPFLDVSVGLGLAEDRTTLLEQGDGVLVDEGEVDTDHSTHTGTYVAPVAGSAADAPVTFRVHTPYSTRNVRFRTTAASPNGTPPVAPYPYPTDPSETLVGSAYISTAAPTLMPDRQSLIYQYEGQYTYARNAQGTKGPGDELDMGAAPWTTLRYGDVPNRLTLDRYRHGYVNPGGSSSPGNEP